MRWLELLPHVERLVTSVVLYYVIYLVIVSLHKYIG